jgi:hypothetical protein
MRQISSLEFSLTRILMRIFRTISPLTVKWCQVNFGILPIACQLKIRTARFLQKFLGSQNHLCLLFAQSATLKLNDIFSKYGRNVRSAAQLSNIIIDRFYSDL